MQEPTETQYRGYFFGNMYLSPIAHGIQAAHVVTKLFVKYPWSYNDLNSTIYECDVLYAWGDEHVTKILLNGGYQSNLQTIYDIFEIVCPVLKLPYAKFHEEVDALNGALTSVGVIVDINALEYMTAIEELVTGEWGGPPELQTLKTPKAIFEYLQRTKGKWLGATPDITPIEVAKYLLHATLKSARLA